MPSSSPPRAELAPGLSVAGKLDPDDIEALAAAGVRTIVNNRPDDEDPGQRPRHRRGAQVAPDELPNRVDHRPGYSNRAMNSGKLSSASTSCRALGRSGVSALWMASHRPSLPPRYCTATTYQIV